MEESSTPETKLPTWNDDPLPLKLSAIAGSTLDYSTPTDAGVTEAEVEPTHVEVAMVRRRFQKS
jgi:hypothetical protein